MLYEEYLGKIARLTPNKGAILDGKSRITFRDLDLRSNRLANALMGLGLRKGCRVAILAKNCHQYLEFFYAMAKIGAIGVTVNTRLKEAELSYVINDSGAEAIIFGETFFGVVDQIRSNVDEVKNFIAIERCGKGTYDYESLLNGSQENVPAVEKHEDDILLLMYTSGTTGSPKGAAMTSRGILNVTINNNTGMKLKSDDVMVQCSPFFHMPLLTSVLICTVGGTSVIMKDFSAEEVLRLIEQEKATVLSAVPTMLNLIVQIPTKKNYDLKSLKKIVYGGSPISPALLKESMDLLNCGFQQFYGATECGGISYLPEEDHKTEGSVEEMRRMRSAGKCLQLSSFAILDEKGKDVPTGEVGEVVVKNDCLMRGYWNRPEETAEVLKNGWYHTGDVGYVDKDGYLYLVDRKKDMIISGGENIYPAEIENVIHSHPSVQSAAVIGIPDPEWGESVKAVVVLKEGMDAGEDDILFFCKERLAGYKRPKSVDFVTALPVNAAGKILKRKLREKYWSGRERMVH